VDYIFIIKADVDLNINPNEVMSYKYVTKDELKQMFETQSNIIIIKLIIIIKFYI